MSESLEGKNISFRKDTGKETEVKVINETFLTRGLFGQVFDTIVEIGGHKKRFIIKKYDDELLPGESPEEHAQIAFQNYTLAKESGLKVFPTFRIGDDEKSILMTNGFSEDQTCIGSNSSVTLTSLEQPLIEKIADLDKFLFDIFSEVLKATNQGIYVYIDNLFFFVSKGVPTRLDFVFGDLDYLSKKKPSKFRGENSLNNIKTVLTEFCNRNMISGLRKVFLARMEEYYKKSLNELKNSELE